MFLQDFRCAQIVIFINLVGDTKLHRLFFVFKHETNQGPEVTGSFGRYVQY